MAKREKFPKRVLKPHYSGALSTEFWRRVNALSDQQAELYACGVLLQNMEGDVLRWLAGAEAKEAQRGRDAVLMD